MGLSLRGKVWHIDKTVCVCDKSRHIRKSTFTSDKRMAEQIMNKEVRTITEDLLYGKRGKWLVDEAIGKYLEGRKSHQERDSVHHCDVLLKHLKGTPLHEIHSSCDGVKSMIDDCLDRGNSNSTINKHLSVLIHILGMASREWRDDNGQSWLGETPKIKLLEKTNVDGHPLTKGQEKELFSNLLGKDLIEPCSFILQTGLRSSTVYNLRWENEVTIPELGLSVFDLPKGFPGLKNNRPHRVVLNTVAKDIIDRQRGLHEEFVFTYDTLRVGLQKERRPYKPLHTSLWKQAVERAGLRDIRGEGKHFRVHDLRHSFAARLRAMGVSREDRKDLLGHTSSDVTTHYSSAETSKLLEAAEKSVNWYKIEKPSLWVINSSNSGQ